MTSLAFGVPGFLSTQDGWGSGDGGGLATLGIDGSGVGWAVDDGDDSYLRWTSHVITPGTTFSVPTTWEGESNRRVVELDWLPGPLDVTSDLTLTVVVRKVGGGYSGPPFQHAAIWRWDGTDLKSFGLGTMDGTDNYVTLTGTIPAGHDALDWLLEEEAFISLRWAYQDSGGGGGQVALGPGNEFRYTRITLDFDGLGGGSGPVPSVRQRQVPR